jgi:flagellar biosynthesis/type III secretory pathway ATPase
MTDGFSLSPYIERIAQVDPMPQYGRVVRTVGLLIESAGPRVSVGTMCEISSDDGNEPLPVQVVGFRDSSVLSVPLGDTVGVRPGDRATASLHAPVRSPCRWARRCLAASSTRSAGRSTAASRFARRTTIHSIHRRSTRWRAIPSSNRWVPACARSTPC